MAVCSVSHMRLMSQCVAAAQTTTARIMGIVQQRHKETLQVASKLMVRHQAYTFMRDNDMHRYRYYSTCYCVIRSCQTLILTFCIMLYSESKPDKV